MIWSIQLGLYSSKQLYILVKTNLSSEAFADAKGVSSDSDDSVVPGYADAKGVRGYADAKGVLSDSDSFACLTLYTSYTFIHPSWALLLAKGLEKGLRSGQYTLSSSWRGFDASDTIASVGNSGRT